MYVPDMYLGIDIGGTFTDLVLMDGDGNIATAKAPTTPGELEKGVFDAVAVAAGMQGLTAEELLGRVTAFGHGTTQATNALIERTGATTGLIATRGFGDTLALQRLMGFTAGIPVEHLGRYSRRRYPDPIVPRRLVREVRERVDQAGRVLIPLDEDSVRTAVRELIEAGAQTFAVALLWSFRNPAHELRVGAIIRDIQPNAFVSLSCEVSPIIGEYERTATTVLNSYLAPKVANYLDRIESLLRDRGFRGKFNVLNSAGGVIPAREAARKPVLLVASGPAGGVMGSLQLAQEIGHHNIITTDMGGTSFDVALVVDGKPLVSGTHEVGGFHLNTPVIDIRAIGAGGGSIARVEAGLLRVGPDSAGAVPGPVCYGRGGKLVTVTDADLVLGIVSPDNFLGGRMKLDREAAAAAIRAQIAAPLGMSVEAAAAGIRRVVDGHMADTLREVTIGRGHDPRDFVLLAYGGAGPTHCIGYGAELGVPRILIPATSMAHSAYGALASDIQQSAERSLLLRAGGGTRDPWEGLDCDAINAVFAELEERCLAAMEQSGFAKTQSELGRSIDMRYRRQTHDLMVAVPDGPVTAATARSLVESFEQSYEAVYGKGAGFRFAGIELTTFRVVAVGRTRKPSIRKPSAVEPPQPQRRRIFEPATLKWTDADVFQWSELPAGFCLVGTAVIEHPETTVYVGPGQTARLDDAGNLSIDLS
jgi:N-methylhydantoinase A